ncbi:MAG: GntR family transcriptional regulator [Spirochaetaceae bacterium]|jgi:GntR family transcriptional regulator|nr:GntR family transcriptional regulator [Spirochaetaceae bacterium]
MNRTIGQTEKIEGGFSIVLDYASGVPVYRQIIRQIEHAILSGRICGGDRLPTIRALAVALKINPNTIAKAYSELEIRGILVTQVGSGTFISDKRPEAEEDRKETKIRQLIERFLKEMSDLGVEKSEIIAKIGEYTGFINEKECI